jgi:mono/diheme cytochrome c family protein
MFTSPARACSVAAVTICLLAACSQESPRKAESPRSGTAADAASNRREPEQAGAALFKQFCFNCHPDGDNVSDPKRPLFGSALRAHHITTPEDIVHIMRHPISRMIRFDAETVSDRDAHVIAEYVLKTFR